MRTLVLLLTALSLLSAQDTHSVPSCALPGIAKRTGAAPCTCPKMVSDIQEKQSRHCWNDYGIPLPDDPEEKDRIKKMILSLDPPKKLTDCLATSPTLCKIVSSSPSLYGYNGPDTCRTACKPERCGCHDTVCPAHNYAGLDYHSTLRRLILQGSF